jgi:hypothetical protein
MEKKIALGVLLITILAIAIAILAPGARKTSSDPKLPWLVEIGEDGANQVFGLTLGKSTIGEIRELFAEDGEVSLFRSPEGRYSLEAYFDKIFLSGLRGNFVFRISAEQSLLDEIYHSGARISQLGSGTSKVEPKEGDLPRIYQLPIELITYIPMANLDEPLIEGRFGAPAQKITEPSGVVHWLYPDKGLDIAYNPKAKEVLQYIHPSQFQRLMEPLLDEREHIPGQRSL